MSNQFFFKNEQINRHNNVCCGPNCIRCYMSVFVCARWSNVKIFTFWNKVLFVTTFSLKHCCCYGVSHGGTAVKCPCSTNREDMYGVIYRHQDGCRRCRYKTHSRLPLHVFLCQTIPSYWSACCSEIWEDWVDCSTWETFSCSPICGTLLLLITCRGGR